jgi:hypothetical protein
VPFAEAAIDDAERIERALRIRVSGREKSVVDSLTEAIEVARIMIERNRRRLFILIHATGCGSCLCVLEMDGMIRDE